MDSTDNSRYLILMVLPWKISCFSLSAAVESLCRCKLDDTLLMGDDQMLCQSQEKKQGNSYFTDAIVQFTGWDMVGSNGPSVVHLY